MMGRVARKRVEREMNGTQVVPSCPIGDVRVFEQPTDVEGLVVYRSIHDAINELAAAGPAWSLWGFYFSEVPLYRLSILKPADSRWVCLRARSA